MSLLFKNPNTICYEWKTTICPQYPQAYSDQFMHNDAKNIVFNIGMKSNTSSDFMELWVKKSNPEKVSAIIKISAGVLKKTVEIRNWEDKCFINDFLTSYASLPFMRRHGHNHYVHDIIIKFEIIWDNIKVLNENNLYDEMQQFYKSQDFSDLTLVVGEVAIPSHKVILSAHSDVFSTMLRSEFKESKENIISVKDIDVEAILEMLHFFYKGTTKANHDTKIALQMLEVSDIYQIEKLKEICESTLLKNMSVDNVLNIFDAADNHHAPNLVKSAINFIVSNSKKVFSASEFEQLFYKKPELMFQLTCAVGDK
ncbi:protein roadkill [Microplitis demolitor]|uniref:protein roadkill n=1 Tax=Microplitis demolitor TaxID=69319 RepID=UPI0004CD3AC4|nr:protein roadkill [Microplitis demolitor]